jgi:hypothetical protein
MECDSKGGTADRIIAFTVDRIILIPAAERTGATERALFL